MTKRERLLHLAEHGELADDYLPAAFFLHFPEECHAGRAAIDKHVEFFRATDNDLAKVQYEHKYPRLDVIRRSHDWTNMPCYDEEFYADQLDVVEGVVRELHDETVVIVTLYSPFMFAGQTVGREALYRHFADDPGAVRAGLDVIVESMGYFIRGCIDRGVDGFYASTQGGERGHLPEDVFDEYVKPTDLAVWDFFAEQTECNVLHVCDYHGSYDNLDRYLDYPGHIVSAPNEIGGESVSGKEIARIFGRPVLGGMERLGVISTGPQDAVAPAAVAAIESGPQAMILGADCTLAASTDWSNIAIATNTAHISRRNA
ncbi:MAG: uroporphyrinogen decarboxylase family protein [Spirochaetota bacterium]